MDKLLILALGKNISVVHDQNRAKRCRYFTPCTPTGLTIREPSNIDCSSSSDDDVPIQLATTLPSHDILKEVEISEKGECSKGIYRYVT